MHRKPCHSTPSGCGGFLAWTMAPPQRGLGSDTARDFPALCLSLALVFFSAGQKPRLMNKASPSEGETVCVATLSTPDAVIQRNQASVLSPLPARFQLLPHFH